MAQSAVDVFSFASILLTGFTGLVGKCFVWKVLNMCPQIKNIFVLVRGNKKTPDARERFESLLSEFPLSELSLEAKQKIVLLEGDLESDFESFKEQMGNVDIVVHSAASVNFEESINASILTNLTGCKRLLDFCELSLKLKLFVYISTAYAHCDQGFEIEEKIYPVDEDPLLIMSAFSWMSTEMGRALSPFLMKTKPNSYIYSKALAENYIQSKCGDLPFPVAIVRPTVIGAAHSEPHPGYIDNLNALTGAIVAAAHGAWRLESQSTSVNFDCIPIDFVVNGIIATCLYSFRNLSPNQPPLLVHLSTGSDNPCCWEVWHKLQPVARDAIPMERSFRYPIVYVVHPWVKKLFIPIYRDFFMILYDCILTVTGNKIRLRRITKKLDRLFALTAFYIQNQWTWEQTTFQKVRKSLSESDSKLLYLDYKVIDWRPYYLNYYKGVKRFLFNENVSDMTKARKRLQFLRFMHYVVEPAILLLLCVLVYFASSVLLSFACRWI